MTSILRTLTVFSALLTGLATGCNESDAPTARYAAFTPSLHGDAEDPVAGIVLALESHERAAIELADGGLVDLELGEAQGEDLLGACEGAFSSGDRTLLPVLTRPLVVGELSFAAPVLEASCDAGTAANRLVLREASDAACDAGACLDFAAPEVIDQLRSPFDDDEALPLRAEESSPDGACLPVQHRDCVSCGGGLRRSRTITSVTSLPPNWTCTYTYTYGSCSPVCGD